MKNIIDDSVSMTPARNKSLHMGLLLWPHFSLFAYSGLIEALRIASSVQKRSQKIRFKLSLISTYPDLPVVSSSGLSVRPEAAHAPPGDFDYIAAIGGGLEHLHQGHRGDRAFLT